MLTKLRQIAMMVNDLPGGIDLYGRVLGMEPCRTGALPQFGLDNAVLPAGNGTFVELLAPADESSAGARFLQRRGEAPYLMIFETDQYDRLIPHLRDMGVRITGETQHEGSRSAFLHPSSCNGGIPRDHRGERPGATLGPPLDRTGRTRRISPEPHSCARWP